AFHPDNRTVATADAKGMVRIIDAVTGQAGPELQPLSPVSALAFSSRGDVVLTATDAGNIQLWDAVTLKPQGKLLNQGRAIISAGFGPDGEFFFSAASSLAAGGNLCLWKTIDQTTVFPCARTERIRIGTISHDGKTIILGTDSGAR